MKIVIPLSKPILATIALFASVGLWNAFFGPLIYLSSSDMQPLTIILRRILISNESLSDTEMIGMDPNPILTLGRTVSLRMAVIFVTIGPIVLIYPFVQKYFVQGALVGSVKG
jgi:putative aldouronate transport system permease protein